MLADKLIPAEGSVTVVVSSPIVTSNDPTLPIESSIRATSLLSSMLEPDTKVPLNLITSVCESTSNSCGFFCFFPRSLINIEPFLAFAMLPDSNENFPSPIDKLKTGLDVSIKNSSTIISEFDSSVKIELSTKDITTLDAGPTNILSFKKI